MNKKIGFQTLGCKVNIYESNALKNELINLGYTVTDPSSDCDAFIVNTCSVTNMADAKSRKIINKMAKLNPNAVLCVMGCYSQTNPEATTLEGVDIIVGNGNKLDIIPLLEDKLLDKEIEKKIKIIDILNHHNYEKLEVTTYDHSRAFVKIEDGCENFCTYCIIPYARGPIRSKPANDVIDELNRVTSLGYMEVVLAGIHTGKYNDNGLGLTGLVKRILNEVTLLKRLRLSSIEINEIDDEFINLMKENEILADHMHLPLQSGSDLILNKMERKYDTSFFREKIKKIKEARPNISITTDIIVGFPYETDKEFNETVEFAKEIGFSKIHVFPYSKRANTKAALMPQVKDSIKKDRALELIHISDELGVKYSSNFIGKEIDVIIERVNKEGYMEGHSSNFLDVIVEKDDEILMKNVTIKLIKIKNEKIFGKVLKK